MTRNSDQTCGTPWWKQARDLEALQGRSVAEATWGTGYYREEPEQTRTVNVGKRLLALESRTNQLYALNAMRQLEIAELKARRHKPRY